MTFKQQTSSNLPKVFLLSQLLLITLIVMIVLTACTSNNMVTAQQQKVQPFVGVSTFAGSAAGGDGLPAIEGSLAEPRFTKFLTNGDYYIAELERIRKVSGSDGLITTIAGGGRTSGVDGIPAVNAVLNVPTSIDIHPITGELYIVELDNNRICKISNDGIISIVAGLLNTGGGGGGLLANETQLQAPIGLAFHPITGELYFTELNTGKISKINSQTYTIETVAGTGTQDNTPDTGLATTVKLTSPYQLVFSPSGDKLYFTDKTANKIRLIHTINNTIETIGGTGSAGSEDGLALNSTFNEPNGLALDSESGELYIADGANNRIRKLHLASGMVTTFAGSGSYGFSGDGGQALNAQFEYPVGVSIRSNQTAGGNSIVIADLSCDRIRQISLSTNIITTIVGGRVGDGYQANKYGQLNDPVGISRDSNGNLIIADRDHGRIRSVSATTGIISTIAGTGIREYNGEGLLATDSSLNSPTYVVTDSRNGDIYICDFFSVRIRKISKVNGTMSTIFGNGNTGYTPDGTVVSDSVSTGYMYGLAINSLGEIIFCDLDNYVVRKIMTNGTLVTIAGITGKRGFSGDGGPAINANLNFPSALFVDPTTDDIYIVDYNKNNYRIRKIFNHNGTIVTVVGSGVYNGPCPDGVLATECTLLYTVGITIDPLNGDLYFIDMYQVKKVFAANGTVVTIAGVVDGGNSDGDGGPAINAKFGYMAGIFLETNTGSGGDMPTIYVSEYSSVRKISPMCPSMYVLNGTECYPTCSGIISTNTQLVCSGRGQCNQPNNCTCTSSNYYGSNCELFNCWGISANSTQVCSSHGSCQSPNQCSCSNGYYGNNCESYSCNSIPHNSALVCSSNGTCAGPDRCECTSSVYYGNNCEQFNCFNINSFNTSVVCSGNGVCTSPDVCVCKNGFKGVKCDQKIVTPPVADSSGGSDRPLPPGKCVTIGNSTICSESSMINTTSHLTIIVALIVMMGMILLSAF